MMASSKERNPSRKSPYGPVRVTIPAKIAYNLETLDKGIDSLVDRLGCRNCFSGADCSFIHEREFVLGEAATAANTRLTAPQPDPWLESRIQAQQVTVVLSKEVSYDLPAIKTTLKKILDLAGCPCHSGLDISYLNEISRFSRLTENINQQLDKQGFAIVGGL